MRPSSTDPQPRPARFDRQLNGVLGWADPLVERRIAEATQRAVADARSLGYAAGWAQGRQEAAQHEAAERVERMQAMREAMRVQAERAQVLLHALQEAARQVNLAATPAWEEVADAVADGALAIARAALGRELAAVDAEAADAVRIAVRCLGEPSDLTVHVNPQDLALVEQLAGPELPAGIRLVADSSLSPGSVLATGPVQRLRRDLPAAVARAEEVLRS